MMRRQGRNRSDRPEEEIDSGELQDFSQRHHSLSNRVERFVMQLVILGFTILVAVQVLHTHSVARRLLSFVDGLEGVPLSELTPHPGELVEPASTATALRTRLTVVSITRRNLPEVTLLIDGDPVGSFKNGTLTATVAQGQEISIDGTGSLQTLEFRVIGPLGLENPVVGASVTTRANVKSFGVLRPHR